MKIITGSTNTTHVTSNDDREFHQGIYGDGLVVLKNGEQLSASIIDNNTIRAKDGDIVYQGCHALILPDTTEDIVIETGVIGKNRKDLIVARYKLDSATGYESLTLEVLKGTETSGTATYPTVTTGDIRKGAKLSEVALYGVEISGVTISKLEKMFSVQEYIKERLDKAENELSELNSNLIYNYSCTDYTEVFNGHTFEEDCVLQINATPSTTLNSSVRVEINGSLAISRQTKTSGFSFTTADVIRVRKGDVLGIALFLDGACGCYILHKNS